MADCVLNLINIQTTNYTKASYANIWQTVVTKQHWVESTMRRGQSEMESLRRIRLRVRQSDEVQSVTHSSE